MADPLLSMTVRRLFPRNEADFRAELVLAGVPAAEVESLVRRSKALILKLKGSSGSEAGVLKAMAEKVSGIAVIPSALRARKEAQSESLLMLTQEQLAELTLHLSEQSGPLADLAKQFRRIDQDIPDCSRTLRIKERIYRRAGRPFIMGILNLTPDSFSDGGKYLEAEAALDHALQMAAEGADFLDIGGESSRPGALPISAEEESRRILTVIEKLASKIDIPISIDTIKAAVARRALESGAQIVNDISALRADPDMLQVIAEHEATVVLMHMQGQPRSMQEDPQYHDLLDEVYGFLQERLQIAYAAGIAGDRLIIDPGIGFGKRPGDNFELLGRLREFSDLGNILIGPSRKSFIGQVLGVPVQERIFGTAAAVAVAVMNGADILRVHDVRAMRETAEITYQCMMQAEARGGHGAT